MDEWEDYEPLFPQETLRSGAREELRTLYDSLEGELTLDLGEL